MKVRDALAVIIAPLLVLVAASSALEWHVRVHHVPPYLLPRPTDVLHTLIEKRLELLSSLYTTALAAVIGFAASVLIGISAGIALASSRWVRRAFYPYTLFFQTVPIVAIAPLLVFWLDAGLTSVATSAFIVSVFPVIANTLSGLLSTDPALLDLFKLYRAGPVSRLWKLKLPYALPSILTGLRVSAGLAVIGTIVSEFMVGTLGDEEGLGVKIVGAIKYGHMDMVFAAVFVTSLLALGMLIVVNLAAFILLHRWHASERN